jgi:hypothetical protein
LQTKRTGIESSKMELKYFIRAPDLLREGMLRLRYLHV